MKTLFTIGYEGASLTDFISTLKRAGVQHVLDIRDVPQSRRPGFSKSALGAALGDNGISYSHVKALGDPKEGREAARRGDYERFRAIFERHLSTAEAQQGLVEAAKSVAHSPTVVLCYERDPKHCHRTIVAERLKGVCSLNVQHLGVVHNAGRQREYLSRAA